MGISESRLPLQSCRTILGIRFGLLAQPSVGIGPKARKTKDLSANWLLWPEDTPPEHLTLYFPKIPLKNLKSACPFSLYHVRRTFQKFSSLLTHKPLIRHFPRFLQALPNHWKSIENIWKSMENPSQIYWTSIEHLSKIDWTSPWSVIAPLAADAPTPLQK